MGIGSWLRTLSILIVVSRPCLSQRSSSQHVDLEAHNRRVQSSGRTGRTWQFGAFGMGGFPPGYAVHNPFLHYQEVLRFYAAGFEAGRMLTESHGTGPFRGRGEAVVEIIPYWQVNHPAQSVTIYSAGSSAPSAIAGVADYNIFGVSATPFAFRWNFMKDEADRLVPWVQPAFGVLWTNTTFPQGYNGIVTSRFNFTPQVGFGVNVFVRNNQSLSLGARAIHVTNFGLSSYDPGVSVVAGVTVGYSWWK